MKTGSAGRAHPGSLRDGNRRTRRLTAPGRFTIDRTTHRVNRDGAVEVRRDRWEWKATQTPPMVRRLRNWRRNKAARAARRVNRHG